MRAQAAILVPRFPRPRPAPSFREAVRQIPGAVGLVTGGTGSSRFGLTATSVAPLSADPPTLIVCLDRGSAGRFPDFVQHHRFGVNILAAQHRALAERFLNGDVLEDVAQHDHSRCISRSRGVPLIEDALLAIECSVDDVMERHGQAIVIGRVEVIHIHNAQSALVYWRGEYDQLGWTEEQIACATGVKGA